MADAQQPAANPTPAQPQAPQQAQGQGRGPGSQNRRAGGDRGGRGQGPGGPGGRRGGQRGGRDRQQREPSEYEEEVLQIDRVTRVVKGGRRLRFRATVVVGNRKGKVGIGIGKSNEVIGAIQKAIRQAKREMITVPLYRHDTIPHDITFKYKSAKIILLPASVGTGIIAGGSVRKIAELAGIKNMLSKIIGTNNRITNAQATMLALGQLRARKAPKHTAAPEGASETTSKTKSP